MWGGVWYGSNMDRFALGLATEIDGLRAALRHARATLIALRTPLDADKAARGETIKAINIALGEHPDGPFKASLNDD